MTPFEFLANRRSHPAKAFSGAVPSRAELLPILTAALRVPDHGKLEPWRMIVLTKSDLPKLADMAEAYARSIHADDEKIAKARGQFDWGHLMVVVIASPKPSEKVPALEQLQSVSALCMNLVNAAEASGWGANWLSGWVAHEAGFARAAFGCSASETVAGIIHIGTVGTIAPDRPRPDVDRAVQWGLPV
jgi:nitroreductase